VGRFVEAESRKRHEGDGFEDTGHDPGRDAIQTFFLPKRRASAIATGKDVVVATTAVPM